MRIHHSAPYDPAGLVNHTHTAVRLKPTSSPANILIAALLPSLEESPAEMVAFPPESSNLMYGMYYTRELRARFCRDRLPDQQTPFGQRDQKVDTDHEGSEHEHAREHARHIEHAFRLLDEVAEPGGRAEILADHGTDHRKADRGMERGEHPGQRRGPIDVAHERPLAHAQHAGIGEDGRAHLLHALIDVEEDDEEHERDAERHL